MQRLAVEEDMKMALAKRLTLALGLLAPSAWGAQGDVVVYVPGMGGTAETARPYLEKFCATLEQPLGWPKGSCQGQYFEDPILAKDYIAKAQPGFGMVSAAVYLDQACVKGAEVEPLAGVVLVGRSATTRYHVVVKDPALKSLDDLKGKRLISNHLGNPKFLSRVLFGGKIDAPSHFKLEPTKSPLKPFKALDRGEAESALVDDNQLAEAKGLPFGAQLKVVFSSEPVTPFPVVAFGKVAKPAVREAMRKTLLGLCGGSPEVCKALQVARFEALSPTAFQAAAASYCKP